MLGRCFDLEIGEVIVCAIYIVGQEKMLLGERRLINIYIVWGGGRERERESYSPAV